MKEQKVETEVEAKEAAASTPAPPRGRYLLTLSLATLGIVYGDIGTSPLYAIRECFHGTYAVHPTPDNILGVLSLIFWALIIVISIKYLAFIMRADNRGEGGILALMALVRPGRPTTRRGYAVLVAMGLFGAALLYGDGMITPAISVLSAIEGLKVATPFFDPFVIPLTIVILLVLFLFQYQGTARVGAIFGPIMLLWFVVLAVLGVRGICEQSACPVAPSTRCTASTSSRTIGGRAFFVLGAVFLAVTGGEALYADMGHFGRRPIRIAWFGVVLPGLLLNYFGQGALLLNNPEATHNPFYRLAPTWALYPMVVLATVGHHHRLAGRDLRLLLAHPSGDPARLLPAPRRSSTPRRRRSARSTCRWSTGSHGDDHRAGDRLRVVEPPGRRLRRRGIDRRW